MEGQRNSTIASDNLGNYFLFSFRNSTLISLPLSLSHSLFSLACIHAHTFFLFFFFPLCFFLSQNCVRSAQSLSHLFLSLTLFSLAQREREIEGEKMKVREKTRRRERKTHTHIPSFFLSSFSSFSLFACFFLSRFLRNIAIGFYCVHVTQTPLLSRARSHPLFSLSHFLSFSLKNIVIVCFFLLRLETENP